MGIEGVRDQSLGVSGWRLESRFPHPPGFIAQSLAGRGGGGGVRAWRQRVCGSLQGCHALLALLCVRHYTRPSVVICGAGFRAILFASASSAALLPLSLPLLLPQLLLLVDCYCCHV